MCTRTRKIFLVQKLRKVLWYPVSMLCHHHQWYWSRMMTLETCVWGQLLINLYSVPNQARVDPSPRCPPPQHFSPPPPVPVILMESPGGEKTLSITLIFPHFVVYKIPIQNTKYPRTKFWIGIMIYQCFKMAWKAIWNWAHFHVKVYFQFCNTNIDTTWGCVRNCPYQSPEGGYRVS